MLYAILIYQAQGALDHLSEEEMQEVLAEHRALQNDTKASGAFFNAIQLTEGYDAATVRQRSGKTTVQDGPFVETKELLIGLYVLDCPDLEAALAHARRVPHAKYGVVEVRPVAYFADHAGVERG